MYTGPKLQTWRLYPSFFLFGKSAVVRSYYELQGEQNLVIFTLSINASLGPEPSEPSRCP